MYEKLCDELHELLANACKCNDLSLKCPKCRDEDHEGYFCRCESRNIKLAQMLREKGVSAWRKGEN
jgi:hypothetical protein